MRIRSKYQAQWFIWLVITTVILRTGTPVEALTTTYGISLLNRTSFPSGFVFGVSSSAYQTEGAATEDGKGPSIWDTFTHKFPEKIKDHSDGNIATDSYHQYKEDVRMIKKMRFDAYRFSISWPRILPYGKVTRGINEQGLHYYSNLINELIKNGIEPFVTLFHWDTPQALEDEYGGFLSSQIVNDYRDYANLCFQTFGNKVKYWTTFNEPSTYTLGGYVSGNFAPGRCSSWQNASCTGGDSGVEPYIVAHNQLLAHAAAVKLYRDNYQASHKGKIGITLETRWMVPLSDESININAADRALDFSFGWFMKPLTAGDYPSTMRFQVGSRLRNFSEEEANMLKGSFDFLGLNYYTSNYVEHFSDPNLIDASYITDSQTRARTERNGVPIGPKGASSWLYVYPMGIHDLLLYIKRNYSNPTIYITENGIDELNNSTLSLGEALDDSTRIDYYYQHLSSVRQAISEGVDVRGYFAWAALDNFEWNSGYTVRFGLNFVDYKAGLKRYKKLSAKWFTNFLRLE
ncbi:hypothetical protein DCAR_0728226 [Daucus carota subsp. sativus]|uniref:Uncharacterized protein n=1 Tax=Daucus carota subsp. sativus TaxID=79200 RepID=A0AAF0XIP0_DAUCS|nr:PREDICTED: beta-glucosidase 24-like [Daucus carota subsp. sativus]WOH08778.1 hypothetical protein DCAR_0728226 [Daucus carota subsp. sativus]